MLKDKIALKKAAKPKKLAKMYTKNELLTALAMQTDLEKKTIALFLVGLEEIILAHLKKGSSEKFVLPGLCKIIVKKVAAKPARMGKNPATGAAILLKAKPASRKLKINALKKLKQAI